MDFTSPLPAAVIFHAAVIVAVAVAPVCRAAPAPPGATTAVGAAAIGAIGAIAIWAIIGTIVAAIIAVTGIVADMDADAGAIIPETKMRPAPGFGRGWRRADKRQDGCGENDTQYLHHSLLKWCNPNRCFR